MSSAAPELDLRRTLADLATQHGGAALVFWRHGLDYCCHGQVTLQDACKARRLDPAQILGELQREQQPVPTTDRWDLRPVEELVDHLLDHFHAGHRRELPRLLAMASDVEQVHRDAPDCPRGLVAHLRHVATELESHMQKEEQILFPMLRQGHGSHAVGPIQVMEAEHEEHGQNLARLRALAHGYTPPAAACNTWRALYRGLADLDQELMRHIHLENHVLFPRVLTH